MNIATLQSLRLTASPDKVTENGRLFRLGTTILTRDDFIISEDSTEFLEEDDSDEITPPNPLPVKLSDDGMRKFIIQFERKMTQKTKYPLTDQQLSYRGSIREQVHHFAKYLRGEELAYQPIALR